MHILKKQTPFTNSADISWDNNGVPFSLNFNDNYFSLQSAEEEASHVFINGNNLNFSWRDKELFTIGESGFGLGINFLTTYKLFMRDANRPKKLTFISYDCFPLDKPSLIRAHKLFPTFKNIAHELHRIYPNRQTKTHKLLFQDGNIELILIFEEAKKALESFNSKIDCWYLDGFAPSKNPQIWRDEVLELIAKNSKIGTTFATYTVAGAVKRGLEKVGFEVFKTKGFGIKNDMLKGSLQKKF